MTDTIDNFMMGLATEKKRLDGITSELPGVDVQALRSQFVDGYASNRPVAMAKSTTIEKV